MLGEENLKRYLVDKYTRDTHPPIIATMLSDETWIVTPYREQLVKVDVAAELEEMYEYEFGKGWDER